MKNRVIIVIVVVLVAAGISIASLVNKARSRLNSNTGKISLSVLIANAREQEAKKDLALAKQTYQKMVNEFSNSNEVMAWQKKVEDINIRLLFSPVITPKSVVYEIKSGDTLTKIAKEFKTTTDLIKKSNNLVDDKIIPGRKIKVWNSPFSILVYKSQNILILKTEDEIFKTYIVSTGKNNCTPVGTFKITSKLINPTWFKAGAVVAASSPENILGTRWMGFDLAGYGIHGTTEPQSLGKQLTAGCVRMSNPEVEELYTIIPQGTEVTIAE